MAQLKNDFTVTLNTAKAKIYHLFKFAEQKQNREDPLYGLYDVILDLLVSTITTREDSSLSSFPQSRLISIARELEGLALARFKTVIPDFALLLTCIGDLDGAASATAPMILEIKPLKPKKSFYFYIFTRRYNLIAEFIDEQPLLWISSRGLSRARAYILFTLAFHRQILSQGFCALNAYPDDIINLIFIVGIYFTHFTFTRPKMLPNVPMHLPEGSRVRYIEANIAKLLPLDCVGIQSVNHCIFDDPSKDGLRLSNAFLTALHDCLLVIPGATNDIQSYSFFSTIPDEQGGNVGGEQSAAKDVGDDKALDNDNIEEEAWRQPTQEEETNDKKEVLASMARLYKGEESHLEDTSPARPPSCYVDGRNESPGGTLLISPPQSPYKPTTRGSDVSQRSSPVRTRKRSLSMSSTWSQGSSSEDEEPARRRQRVHSPDPFSGGDVPAFSLFDPTLETGEEFWVEDTSLYDSDDEDAGDNQDK